jgi:FMN-dependent NADH-azoreductase
MERVDGKYMLLQGKDLFGELKEAWGEIIAHIERFLLADVYLISTPMWNFSVPYRLKQYIEVIVQPKYLFRYTENGQVEGLAKNKKMIIACSRGGSYLAPDKQGYDFQEPYLKTIFGFVGIQDITFLTAEPMDMGQQMRQEGLSSAKVQAKKRGQDA